MDDNLASPTVLLQRPSKDPWDEERTIVADGDQGGEDPALRPTLEVVEGAGVGTLVRLGAEPVRIGRAPGNDLVLADDSVSRAHARVVYEEGHWVIEDLGSANGILVDGQPVTRLALAPGLRLTLGRCVLAFQHTLPEVALDKQHALLGRCDVLAALGAEGIATLAAGLVPRFVPKGAIILRQGRPIERMLFVVKGAVRLAHVNEEGGQRDVDLLIPGDFFGEGALLSEPVAPVTLFAHSDVLLLELASEAVARLQQEKPRIADTMVGRVREKLRTAAITAEPAGPRDGLAQLAAPTDVVIVGEDPKLVRAKQKLETLAADDRPILIVGPQGSGKRTFARHLHRTSPRADQPFVELSLAELEPAKVGAALFGVEADASATGGKGQIGYLEMVGDGTLAIVHAELLDTHQQHLLLTYLRRGWFHRVWGQQSVHANARLVFVASGSEAEALQHFIPELKELFRERTVAVPALAHRLKDIPLLAQHYLALFARKHRKRALQLSREAVDRLVSYAWPGNVEELKNVIERASIITSEDTIIPADLIFVAPPEKEIHKLNLLRDDRIRQALRAPALLGIPTWINLAFVAFVAIMTGWGATRPLSHPLAGETTNPGMLVTWLVWFPLLPISAALAGRVWCATCPIAAFGELVGRLKRLDLPVPKLFKRLDFWMLIGAYLLAEFLEGVFDVEGTPRGTALFLIVILGLAALFTVLFERRAFCRYLCPLAAWLGGYAAMAPIEIRGNKKVCQTQCGDHTCYKGTEHTPGCPMFLYPASMTSNVDCLMCTNCLKNCENRGVQLNLRPPFQELWRNAQPVLAVSMLAIILLGIMGRHHFTHTPFWTSVKRTLTLDPNVVRLLLLLLFVGGALLAFAVAATLSAAASRERLGENLAHYGLAFMPLAFAAHVSALADEVLGDGWAELFGYLGKVGKWLFQGVPIAAGAAPVGSFLHPAVVTFVRMVSVAGGLGATVLALVMIARRLDKQAVFARTLPHLLLAIGAAVALGAMVLAAATG